ERPGAYGVLIDNVLGYAVIAGAPQDHWAVTTEMSVDFLGPMSQQHEVTRAEAHLLDIDGSNGYSEGTLTDSAGRVFARMRQRARIISESPTHPETNRMPDECITNFDASETEMPLERIFGLTPVLQTQQQWSVDVSES